MPRRHNPKDDFWLVNLLADGDLEGQSKPHPVKLHRCSEGPNEDGSFTCLVDDGQVYISAFFQSSAVKEFKRRCAKFEHSQPHIFNTQVCLKKYKVIHRLHNDQNLCEFGLQVEEFTEWNWDDGVNEFRHNDLLVDCMTQKLVRARSNLLWNNDEQTSEASLGYSLSLPFIPSMSQTESTRRSNTQTQLAQADGSSQDLRTYLVKSFRTQPFRIDDFLISDEDKRQLSLIEEWQADYRPPVTPSVSLTSGSLREHGGMDDQHGGITPALNRGQTTNDNNRLPALDTDITGPLTAESQQQEVTSSNDIDECSVVMTTAARDDTHGGVGGTDVRVQSIGVQVHASQDVREPLVSDHRWTRRVDAGVQVGGIMADRHGSRTDDSGEQGTDRDLQDAQVVLSRDGSTDNSLHAPNLPTTHVQETVHPPNLSLCPLVDGSLDAMLGCTDHSSRPDHSRGSDQDCGHSHDLTCSGTAMRNNSINTEGCSDIKRRSRVCGAGRVMCSTQVDCCPLEQLVCLDVSAVDQSVTDNVAFIAPGTQTRTRNSYRTARDTLRTESDGQDADRVTHGSNIQDATRLDDVDKRQEHHRHSSDDTVNGMTQRTNSSTDSILLNDQQEEQRLAEMTKMDTIVSDPHEEPSTEPDSPHHHSPVLVSLASPMVQSTHVMTHREPVICIPLSGSETFTQQPRQKQQAFGPRWDVDVLYEPKRQRKQRRVRKLYTESVLLSVEDAEVPAVQTNDGSPSRKAESGLTDRIDGTGSQPDSCTFISSSSEHCTPAAPVDDAVRNSGNTISSTNNNDSVASSELDRTAIQQFEMLFSAELSSIQQNILDLDFTEKDPSLIGFTTMYFTQQKFGYNA